MLKHLTKIVSAFCILLGVFFVGCSFWFAYIREWKLALFTMGFAMISVMIPVVLSPEDPLK